MKSPARPQAGQSAAATFSDAPPPSFLAPSLPPSSFPGEMLPAAGPSASSLPVAAFAPDGDDLESLPFALPAGGAGCTGPGGSAGWSLSILHIRCPAGHLVKATSDLLGKNGRCPACKRTFELRYEHSVEFQRRMEKILQREEVKTERAWLAWAFLAAFLLFTGAIAIVIAINR